MDTKLVKEHPLLYYASCSLVNKLIVEGTVSLQRTPSSWTNSTPKLHWNRYRILNLKWDDIFT